MKINGIRTNEGVKIKSVGLSKEEQKMILDDVKKTFRKIQYKREKENRPRLSYWIDLK